MDIHGGSRAAVRCDPGVPLPGYEWGPQSALLGGWAVPPFPAYGGGGVYPGHVTGYPAPPPERRYPAGRAFPVVPGLPCQQRPQPWDYAMCYNVDGQPCQYTDVVDLEDFMNNEKRKEKSRVAARCRRTKEMQIFSELTAALPARKEELEQLDKASVMRLAISYLRVRDVVSMLPKSAPETAKLQLPKDLGEVSSEHSYMRALHGFVLALSQQGDIVYCSENISEHLGVTQMEIMGQSVFEFSHPCDHEEVREALRGATSGASSGAAGGATSGAAKRELMLRLKCTLTGKGRNVHLKSASYKVIHVTGHMLTPDHSGDSKEADKLTGSLIAVGRPIPHPANISIPLDTTTFLTKHNLDMKFTYTDESLQNTFGFEPNELVGRSLYDYHHAGDTASLAQQFKSLFAKGQCETGQYRFLGRSGGYCWVQTQATVITDKQQRPVSVVCVNYMVSGIECKDEVFAAHQLQHADLKPAPAAPSVPVSVPASVPASVPYQPADDERPIPVTETLFAPRNKDMNEGFLMFSQKEGTTMLKDEPEDLTHLAPTAGDACIPLENNPFDMFEEFILNDNYCSLLSEDLATGSPVDSLGGDPMLMSSPDTQETDSSCERSSLLTEFSLDTFDSGRSEGEVDGGKSPFIPLTDEMPVLETAVMWGALPENVSLARPQPSEPGPQAPALKRLLAAPPTGPPPHDLITNIYSDQGLIPNSSVPWDTTGTKRQCTEEPPTAKRARRSASPARPPSSSVLMNLLDLPQPVSRPPSVQPDSAGGPQRPRPPLLAAAPDGLLAPPPDQFLRIPTPNARVSYNTLSPLTLKVDNTMYAIPSDFSPGVNPKPSLYSVSPGRRGLYSPGVRLSAAGLMQPHMDPYLTSKMQISPGLEPPVPMDTLEPALGSPGFWSEPAADGLLSALDDVKL